MREEQGGIEIAAVVSRGEVEAHKDFRSLTISGKRVKGGGTKADKR